MFESQNAFVPFDLTFLSQGLEQTNLSSAEIQNSTDMNMNQYEDASNFGNILGGPKVKAT